MEFTYEKRSQIGEKGRFGLIVLKSDETVEDDFRRFLPPEFALFTSRIESAAEVTPDYLAQMQGKITASSALFPDAIEFDAIGYACTSASSVIGETVVADLVKRGAKVNHVTNPLTALVAACAALEVQRLGILSPYIPSVNDHLRAALQGNGIETPVLGTFNEAKEENVARICENSIISSAKEVAATAEIEALFLSCTNLRTMDIISQIEEEIGIPVLSSNQVMLWHMLATKRAPNTLEHLGRLFQSDLI